MKSIFYSILLCWVAQYPTALAQIRPVYFLQELLDKGAEIKGVTAESTARTDDFQMQFVYLQLDKALFVCRVVLRLHGSGNPIKDDNQVCWSF